MIADTLLPYGKTHARTPISALLNLLLRLYTAHTAATQLTSAAAPTRAFVGLANHMTQEQSMTTREQES